MSGCFARPCAHEGIEKLAKRLRSSLSKQFPRAHRCCSMTAFWRRGAPTHDHLRECPASVCAASLQKLAL